MKRFVLALTIVCFVLSSFATAVTLQIPPKTHPDSSKWSDLFRPDLSNAIVPKNMWAFTDGVLTAAGKYNEFIWTKKSFDNFIIDLEFKTTNGADSGVIVYCSDEDWIQNAIGVKIADDYSDTWSSVPKIWQCGAFMGRSPALKQKVVKKPGKWNRMTITCIDNMIYVMLNGKQINVMDMKKWTDSKHAPDGTELPSWFSEKPVATLPTKGRIGLRAMPQDAPGCPSLFSKHKSKKINSVKEREKEINPIKSE